MNSFLVTEYTSKTDIETNITFEVNGILLSDPGTDFVSGRLYDFETFPTLINTGSCFAGTYNVTEWPAYGSSQYAVPKRVGLSYFLAYDASFTPGQEIMIPHGSDPEGLRHVEAWITYYPTATITGVHHEALGAYIDVISNEDKPKLAFSFEYDIVQALTIPAEVSAIADDFSCSSAYSSINRAGDRIVVLSHAAHNSSRWALVYHLEDSVWVQKQLIELPESVNLVYRVSISSTWILFHGSGMEVYSWNNPQDRWDHDGHLTSTMYGSFILDAEDDVYYTWNHNHMISVYIDTGLIKINYTTESGAWGPGSQPYTFYPVPDVELPNSTWAVTLAGYAYFTFIIPWREATKVTFKVGDPGGYAVQPDIRINGIDFVGTGIKYIYSGYSEAFMIKDELGELYRSANYFPWNLVPDDIVLTPTVWTVLDCTVNTTMNGDLVPGVYYGNYRLADYSAVDHRAILGTFLQIEIEYRFIANDNDGTLKIFDIREGNYSKSSPGYLVLVYDAGVDISNTGTFTAAEVISDASHYVKYLLSEDNITWYKWSGVAWVVETDITQGNILADFQAGCTSGYSFGSAVQKAYVKVIYISATDLVAGPSHTSVPTLDLVKITSSADAYMADDSLIKIEHVSATETKITSLLSQTTVLDLQLNLVAPAYNMYYED